MKISQREHEHRLVVDLPDLRHSDLVDMARLLQAITNAFSTHHQAALQQQCQHEQQLELFNSVDDQQNPF